MFYKPFYTTLLIFAALFFSFQKSNAGNSLAAYSHTDIPQTFSKATDRIAQQIVNDILTDSNDDEDDDETSSKAKHKLPKITVTFPTKFNAPWQAVSILPFSACCFACAGPAHHFQEPSFSKTRISIAIRCLRI